MRKLSILLSLFACVACSEQAPEKVSFKSVKQVEAEEATQAPQGDVSVAQLEAATVASDFGNIKVQQSPYNFASSELLFDSIVAQADKEGLDTELVFVELDNLLGKFVTEEFQAELSKMSPEQVENALLEILMREMKAKPLKEILGIE